MQVQIFLQMDHILLEIQVIKFFLVLVLIILFSEVIQLVIRELLVFITALRQEISTQAILLTIMLLKLSHNYLLSS